MTKPPGETFHKSDYEIRTIPLAEARLLVEKYHYAKSCSNTAVFKHGLFRKDSDEILGVALWLPPTRPAALWVDTNWKGVLSLTRLVIVPGVPTNAASFLMAASIREIRKDVRWTALVTYADTAQGHTGAIYRAANWEYRGEVKGHPVWKDADGRQVSTKATVNRTYPQMLELGYVRFPALPKIKFTMKLR